MTETIDESVAVDLVSSPGKGDAFPYVISWRGRRYIIRKVGLHHTLHQGRTLIHVFSVTDGTMFFRLLFDTETLRWKLTEIDG